MRRHEKIKKFNIPVDLSMYDKLPYHIDPDTKKCISLVSGNLIKGYTVNMEEEKRVIDPIDFDENVIESHAKEKSSTDNSNQNVEASADSSENISDAQANSPNEQNVDEVYTE